MNSTHSNVDKMNQILTSKCKCHTGTHFSCIPMWTPVRGIGAICSGSVPPVPLVADGRVRIVDSDVTKGLSIDYHDEGNMHEVRDGIIINGGSTIQVHDISSRRPSPPFRVLTLTYRVAENLGMWHVTWPPSTIFHLKYWGKFRLSIQGASIDSSIQ